MQKTAVKMAMGTGGGAAGGFKDRSKPDEIRFSNIAAAKAVADAVRTSLGPKGMDKMIQEAKGDVTITNDGATILQQMKLAHPAAKMLVELSRAQDAEAGDGTTSVVILAGALLDSARALLQRGIHPSAISRALQATASHCSRLLGEMSVPVQLDDRASLLKSASTALNSKVVHQHSGVLSSIAVDAVLKVIDPLKDTNVDLKDIKVMKILGGVVEDTEMVDGLVLRQKCSLYGAPARVEKARIGLIQFCISPPKTDMDNQVVVSDYSAMDRVLREERQYLLNIVKQIKKAGCNVLLVQKSILRDAVSDLAHHFLGKMKIMVVKEVEREDVEFVCRTLGVRPVASLDHFTADVLATADLVEEVSVGAEKTVRITGIQHGSGGSVGHTVTVLMRGSNKLVLEEADRSLHDALCVIRCLVKQRALVAGGGAPEMQLAVRLTQMAPTASILNNNDTALSSNGDSSTAGNNNGATVNGTPPVSGVEAYCVRAFADAFTVIPFTLAENAGLNAITRVTELRSEHANGNKDCGIDVRRGCIADMRRENVLQPLLVSQSAVSLAAETVCAFMKIDDIINSMN